MKTKLPDSITSIEGAKEFLAEMYKNGETFHPEDDANDIIWLCEEPTQVECDQLNKLMDDIYNLPGNEHLETMVFDPCEFILSLQK